MKNNSDINYYNLIIRNLPKKLSLYAIVIRYDRAIGFRLLFWPCIIGMGAALTEKNSILLHYSPWQFIVNVTLFYCGAILMRGFGCIINDLIDRDLDKEVSRTKARPISSGAVSHIEAKILALLLAIVSFGILLSFNLITIIIGLFSLPLILIYPLMKRFTWYPQAFLGIVFNWGALLGYTSITNNITLTPFILHFALFFWTIGYDSIYALQDIEDDMRVGIYSTARRFSQYIHFFVSMCYLSCLIILFILTYYIGNAHIISILCISLAAIHMAWQVYTMTINNDKRNLMLFRSNNIVGMFIATGFCFAYIHSLFY